MTIEAQKSAMIRIIKKCPFCRTQNSVDVSAVGFIRWRMGELIQRAMPELSASQREILMTGICDDCCVLRYIGFQERPDG